MLKKIIKFVQKVKQPSRMKSDMEKFIISKGPKTAGDVEHWQNEFQRRHSVNRMW